jgi:hypothetical protein
VAGTTTSLFSTTLAANSYGSSTSFGSLVVTLGAGDSVDFALNNLGDFSFDSTGISATIRNVPTGVPEPASWALMIAGFGVVGGIARRRNTPEMRLA